MEATAISMEEAALRRLVKVFMKRFSISKNATIEFSFHEQNTKAEMHCLRSSVFHHFFPLYQVCLVVSPITTPPKLLCACLMFRPFLRVIHCDASLLHAHQQTSTSL